jgi:hypothetical protein
MTSEPLRILPKGTVGYSINELFSKAIGFEDVPDGSNATNEELTLAVQELWTATRKSLQMLAEATGNPPWPLALGA